MGNEITEVCLIGLAFGIKKNFLLIRINSFFMAGNISQAGNCSCGGVITQITHNGVDMHKPLKPKVWYSIELKCNKCGYHYDTGRKNDVSALISMAQRVATDAGKLQ